MTTPKYLKAWIMFFLIATVGGAVAGGIVGLFLGMILGVAGVGLGAVKLACGAAGFLAGIPISYFTFRWVVEEFVIKAIIPAPQQSTRPQPIPPTLAQNLPGNQP